MLLTVLFDFLYFLGTLGELEEVNPTLGRISCEKLYREAIESARVHYRNHHVYPYTYQGNYYNRLNKYREAFASWANAADVIRLYTYQCRDDEEVYKELLDIANEMIPYVMKTESSGHSARSILRDSEVFANLLRFYDGICQWEEDSLTPILHIGWAKPLVNNICKFDYDVRSQLVINVPEESKLPVNRGSSLPSSRNADHHHASLSSKSRDESDLNEVKCRKSSVTDPGQENIDGFNVVNNSSNMCNNRHEGVSREKFFGIVIGFSTLIFQKCVDQKRSSEMPPTLADLTAACGEKLLNPDFLLQGGGQPFAEQQRLSPSNASNSANGSDQFKHSSKINGGGEDMTTKATSKSESLIEEASIKSKDIDEMKNSIVNQQARITDEEQTPLDEDDPRKFMLKHPVITLYSQKMKGLKDLLLAEKLNTHAISLQVTAQSVASKKVRGIDKNSSSTIGGNGTGTDHSRDRSDTGSGAGSESIALSRPKRSRRE